MPDIFIILLIVAGFLIGIMYISFQIIDGEFKKRELLYLLPPTLLLCWIVWAYQLPWQIEKSIIREVKNDGQIQYITFINKDNEFQIVNLNKELGISLKEGARVKIDFIKEVSRGIYWAGPEKFSRKYRLELLDE
jgi:hypothetical protein